MVRACLHAVLEVKSKSISTLLVGVSGGNIFMDGIRFWNVNRIPSLKQKILPLATDGEILEEANDQYIIEVIFNLQLVDILCVVPYLGM
mmetsp:Transcript_5676/g.6564  ORF Transcript_5676/g.6564 Transcript_5676/m.6564 type:complete len:89 (+) Transcript_5676:281-547(+)